ncbi:hypothetical protein [Salinispira pacifica]|uniref:Uncharacterized protein n=1 Tax=Salinispira pacifica TaxID=1307761 RepID=V5WFB3_9SPIO|nr:hypothetical protein [Salinispira pacifica]AHC14239.1 hypothetical protein L21SP2_0817 [Salinispira pacifica]
MKTNVNSLASPLFWTARILPAGFLLLMLASLFFLFPGISSMERGDGSRDQGNMLIIEVPGSTGPASEVLEDYGVEGILHRGNATLQFNNFSGTEVIRLTELLLRNSPEDPRIPPYLSDLAGVFQASRHDGGLLYVVHDDESVPDPDALSRHLSRNGIANFIHVDKRLPPLFGVLIWTILFILVLIYNDGRFWTLIAGAVVLPLFSVRIPIHFSLLIIYFIALRDLFHRQDLEYQRALNRNEAGEPRQPGLPGLLKYFLRMLYSQHPYHLFWIAGLGVAILLSALSYSSLESIMLIPLTAAGFWVLLGVMNHHRHMSTQREHPLFFTRGITPSWDQPGRKERILVIAAVLIAVSVPVVFRVNAAGFPVTFISAEVTGSLENRSDTDALLREVKEVMDLRVVNEDRPGAYSSFSPAGLILANRAYQQAFPYLALRQSDAQQAGRYRDGRVLLSRYRRVEDGELESYDEVVLEIGPGWLEEQLEVMADNSMLQLYSDGERWYDVRPESSVPVFSRGWSLIPELILLLLAAFPWISKARFTVISRIIHRLKTGSGNTSRGGKSSRNR